MSSMDAPPAASNCFTHRASPPFNYSHPRASGPPSVRQRRAAPQLLSESSAHATKRHAPSQPTRTQDFFSRLQQQQQEKQRRLELSIQRQREAWGRETYYPQCGTAAGEQRKLLCESGLRHRQRSIAIYKKACE